MYFQSSVEFVPLIVDVDLCSLLAASNPESDIGSRTHSRSRRPFPFFGGVFFGRFPFSRLGKGPPLSRPAKIVEDHQQEGVLKTPTVLETKNNYNYISPPLWLLADVQRDDLKDKLFVAVR